jgi:hypothetical protein
MKSGMRTLLKPFLRKATLDIVDSESISRVISDPREDRNILMHLPAHMLVMQGAFAYVDGYHPFVETLKKGPEELRVFYKRFQPRGFYEFYQLVRDNLVDDLPPWEIPWISPLRRKPPQGEGGLGIEHGVSFYGPVTEEKIELEYERLDSVLRSIRIRGYRPKPGSGIRGHFMKFGGQYRFFVRGGKHRSAVLAFLGRDVIPVRFCPDWPRLVDHEWADQWPLVRDGLVLKKDAQAAFRRYFEFDGTQQMQGFRA